ncbi:neuroligin-3 [Plakobranchus ocellatus]|uniref:Carboxylic ester hydrolase n=1 Tax=Plakobranchus ocellatus TaxID=259542 RepID=A0AAV3Y0G9_9GAST|nr:neuroligin-3 [Plakobranchus ocellatus]
MRKVEATLLLVNVFQLARISVEAGPRLKREVEAHAPYAASDITVTTSYGDLKGRTYSISSSVNLDIFLGVPYARPPVGDLRFARPEPAEPWKPRVRDATVHGAQCLQKELEADQELVGVPFAEDCLFLDIYTTRRKDSPGNPHPVMVYIHPGSFHGGTGAKYNYTNLALKGVVVVSINYRLDVFGFLSTQDDAIPGNVGLLDAAQALDFVKEIIADFGGNPGDVTLFGASAGAAMVSMLTISPLTRGKFQKAIMQSGAALCPWTVFGTERSQFQPKDMALELAYRLGCSVLETTRDFLSCLRQVSAEALIAKSVSLQDLPGILLYGPVSNDSFGFLPELPEKLLEKPSELVAIPTMYGFTTDDSSWMISDPDDNGVTPEEFFQYVHVGIRQNFPPSDWDRIDKDMKEVYMPDDPSKLSPLQRRAILSRIITDLTMRSCIVKEARMFSRASAGQQTTTVKTPSTFVYEWNYRPSYSPQPLWHGVTHMDERGFVLGLPPGPDAFSFPNTTSEDRLVAEHVTTMWANFAKFGDPTPEPVDGKRWPAFGHSPDDQAVMLIRPELDVRKFEANAEIAVWFRDPGLDDSPVARVEDSAIQYQIKPCMLLIILFSSLMINKFLK